MKRSVISLSVALALGMSLFGPRDLLPAGGDPLRALARQPSEGEIEPFTIDVPDEALADLRERLERARLPDEPEGVGWRLGMNQAYLTQLIEYWRDEFDWRAQERRLNGLEQFKTRIDGLDIHFVHRRSPEPDAFPLILTHGWPGTFAEFAKVIGPLTDPVAHGGRAEDAFHVVGAVDSRLRLLGPAAPIGLRAGTGPARSSRSSWRGWDTSDTGRRAVTSAPASAVGWPPTTRSTWPACT